MTYPSSTNANGIWTLKEAKFFRSANQWPRGPISPTNLTAFSGDTLLSLTWTAPVTTYGTVTNYLVEYTPSGGSSTTVLTNSVNTSYTLTGLTNDTEYTVRVAAVNFTTGEYSAEATGTPVSIVLTKLTGNYTGTGTFDSPYSGNTQGSSLFRAEVSGTVFGRFPLPEIIPGIMILNIIFVAAEWLLHLLTHMTGSPPPELGLSPCRQVRQSD